MSVISQQQPVPYARASQAASARFETLRRLAAGLLLAAAVVSVVALIGVGGLLIYGKQHTDRIFDGTSAAGVDLSGMTVPEAEAALQERFDAYLNQPITLSSGDARISATPDDLGVRIDTRATVASAYAFGRQDSLWVESRNWLDALAGGHTVVPVVSVDDAVFAAYLESHTGSIVTAPRDAALVLDNDGQIVIEPAVDGVAVDVGTTLERFSPGVHGLSLEPIEIATVPVAPETASPELRAVLERVETLAGDSLRLTLDGTTWEIPQADLFAMLHVERDDGDLTVTLDEREFRSYIRGLESSVFTPAVDASVRNDNGTFVAVPAVLGYKLDVDASVRAATEALEEGQARVALKTNPVLPNVTDEEIEAAIAEASRYTARPLTLTWDGGTGTLDPAKVARAIRFEVDAGRNPNITIKYDEESMRRALALVANDVEAAPINAELRWINGQVEVRRPETLGRELDLQATIAGVQRALRDSVESIAVVTRDVQPPVTAASAGSVQIRDRLSRAQTEYGSSVPNRLHNVELAASRVSGALVPPGGVFSFNEAVGPVTFDSGYRTGYGIVGASNGSISTIPSVGGGICQVATTVFQTAFWAGMPMIERSWHLYWIPRYGQPPSGMKGLDATVDPDYGLDFKFRNASNDWIAVVSSFNGSYLTFELWGTNPGWEVIVDPAVYSSYRPASQEMVYETSDQLPSGTSVFVEHAEDGFDAAIHRVVKKDGQVIDDATLVSTYAPARNVTLVGTGS